MIFNFCVLTFYSRSRDTKDADDLSLKARLYLANIGDKVQQQYFANDENIKKSIENKEFVFNKKELFMNPEELVELGIKYHNNDEKTAEGQNYYVSFYLFKKAMFMGSSNGLRCVGFNTYRGLGIKKDEEKGLAMIKESALKGCTHAIDFLESKDFDTTFLIKDEKIRSIGKSTVNAVLTGFIEEIKETNFFQNENELKFNVEDIKEDTFSFTVTIIFRKRIISLKIDNEFSCADKLKEFLNIFIDLNKTKEDIEKSIQENGFELSILHKVPENLFKYSNEYDFNDLDEEDEDLNSENDDSDENFDTIEDAELDIADEDIIEDFDEDFDNEDNDDKIEYDKSEEVMIFASEFAENSFESINFYDYDFKIPSYLKAIRSEAFEFSSLKKIEIPETVEIIEKGAFQYSDLEEIKLPQNIEIIEDSVFYSTNITEIEIPKSVKCIKENAFQTNSLKKICIPDSVEYLDLGVFNLDEITISSKNKNFILENGVLYNKDKTKILATTKDFKGIVCDSVKTLKIDIYESLKGEKNLNIVLPKDLQEIEFNLTLEMEFDSLTIPKNLSYIERNTFDDIKIKKLYLSPENKKFVLIDGVLYDKEKSAIYIADESCENVTIQEGIESIERTFKENKNLKSIILPKSLRKICSEAFKCCYNLKSVNLPKYLEVIEDNAFNACLSLEKIEIPEYLSNIEDDAFKLCNKIDFSISPKNRYFVYENGLLMNNRKNKIIYVNRNIENAEIPETITSIEDYTFHKCQNLKTIKIHKNVDYISDISSFTQTISLEKIYLDSENEYFVLKDNMLFSKNISQLLAVEKHIKKLNIPKKCNLIHNDIFSGCTEIEEITTESNSFSVKDGILYNENGNILTSTKSIKSATLNNIKGIPACFFLNKDELEKITISSEENLFIANTNFNSCKKLSKIIFDCDKEFEFYENCFENCENLKEIYVKRDSGNDKLLEKIGLKDLIRYLDFKLS